MVTLGSLLMSLVVVCLTQEAHVLDVNNLFDDITPASFNCNASSHEYAVGRCSLRSAWTLCSSLQGHCDIVIPPSSSLEFNISAGGLQFVKSNIHISIHGNDSNITSSSRGSSPVDSLISFHLLSAAALSISNLSISNFGSMHTDGSVIHLNGPCSLSLLHVHFSNNVGYYGGSVFVNSSSSEQIVISDSYFSGNSAVLYGYTCIIYCLIVD